MIHTSQRTQVLLPVDLRKKIDRMCSITSESLGEFLRKAAQERLERELQKKASLTKLAEEVIGSLHQGSWKDMDVVAWQRDMRADRN
ncbi:MAG: hypothetical protein HYV33_03300 [Candidatus Kerfeldbacteria bacterium]|nr:hypothetical protein [Candidatus Kerfeldbacteria bacterium]